MVVNQREPVHRTDDEQFLAKSLSPCFTLIPWENIRFLTVCSDGKVLIDWTIVIYWRDRSPWPGRATN
ncbi:MAG: hypothetical protein U9Q78_02260 [Chloroflexota bacterium]|nr:hypothetical protein [Chloroflexota bacterium]